MSGRPRSPAWRRLGRAMRPSFKTSHLVVAALCLALGFGIVASVRNTRESGYASLRQNELVEVLDQLSNRADQLRQENADLEAQLDALRDSTTREQAAREAAETQRQVEGILAGTIPATGPGIELEVDDPGGSLDASLMAALVDELRNAGAEAIQVGEVRITAQSWFGPAEGGGLAADSERLDPPYIWLAIGDGATLQAALAIPGGALAAIRAAGGQAQVTVHDAVEITAVKTAATPKLATAVE